MKVDCNTASGKPKCNLQHPRAPDVVEACTELILKQGSCCWTLFIKVFPDLSSIFDKKSLKEFLSRQHQKIRKKLQDERHENTVPPNPYKFGKRPTAGTAVPPTRTSQRKKATTTKAKGGEEENRNEEEDEIEEEEQDYDENKEHISEGKFFYFYCLFRLKKY